MDATGLTEATLFDILLDPGRRTELRAATRRDVALTNQYFDLAYTAGDEAKLGAAVRALLGEAQEDDDELLAPLLSNPGTPHEALWAAYRQGRGITALGHRRGPRALLEALAGELGPEEHGYDEAVTSLALFHYAGEDDAFFRAFVERHRASFMLRYNLRRSPLVPDPRRALVADLIEDI